MNESPALAPGPRERGMETKMQLPGVPESGARLLQAISSFPSLSMNNKLHILKIHSLINFHLFAAVFAGDKHCYTTKYENGSMWKVYSLVVKILVKQLNLAVLIREGV